MWQRLADFWRQYWQRLLLIVAALLVPIYLGFVLTCGQLIPDIGLVCIFSPDVLRVNPEQIAESPVPPETGLKGAKVLQIGLTKVQTWPNFLQGLRELTAIDDSDQSTPSHRVVAGEEQVLVKLRRDDGPVL